MQALVMSGKQFLFVSQITASGIHTLVSVRKQKDNARRCMWLMKPLRSSGKSKVGFLPWIASNLKNNVEYKTTLFCRYFLPGCKKTNDHHHRLNCCDSQTECKIMILSDRL